MAVLSVILAPLLAGICIAKPLGTRVADAPIFATDSVATFTWADATQTTTATFTLPKREAVPTWPRRMHHPLDIARLAQSSPKPIRVPQGDEEKDLVVTPKHQVEHPPIKTGIHHEPISAKESRPTSHVPDPTKTSTSPNAPTEIALLHEAAILHERQDVSTFTFTGISTTATFTFSSPTGTGAFSSLFTLTDTTGLPFQKERRDAATTVTAAIDGLTRTFTFSEATDFPFTALSLDKRVTAAPTPSAYPVNAVDTCADACDAADVSCSELLTSYTANTLCSSWFTSCHSFCSLASATAIPTLSL
ncbi:hypothetical protein M409DRAFT_57283 [Zasmidium cellare ATCC 36951]|uniref:Uncharacterized protein n=1 Tax=Zasmidium cellare ATCC 36951 TaxID=1080233 RepID=A0A6A6C9I5_ZASCE|nr:uncharacterized protein M409DRAFT_57283 [Zasmidium cellare ATCC 36951]KAF2163804.1 hypothetical protein M409DRAFT_57283 [Zasmidium cellare ATCC 36951]